MKKVLFLAFAMLLNFKCGKIDEGIDQFRLFREQSIYEINSASRQIESGIGDITDILDNLNRNLPKEIHKTLTFDVPFIIDAATDNVLITGLCFADVAAQKALYLLELMKSEIITGEPVPLPAPFICHTTPGVINLNQDRNQRDWINFVGPNLYLNRKFTAELISMGGDTIPVPVLNHSGYEVQAFLDEFSDDDISAFRHLSLYYENELTPISSLYIIKKHAAVPEEKVASGHPKPNILDVIGTSHNDDSEFYWDSRVGFSVTFAHNTTEAWVELSYFIDEYGGNYPPDLTYALGTKKHTYYYAPPGWHIKNFVGGSSAKTFEFFTFDDINNNEDVWNIGFGQLTTKAKGSIAGSTTRATFNCSNAPEIILESN